MRKGNQYYYYLLFLNNIFSYVGNIIFNKLQKNFPLKLLIIIAVFLGVLNVLSNIVLPLSILHLAIADFLWISYIYVSIDLSKNNLFINSL